MGLTASSRRYLKRFVSSTRYWGFKEYCPVCDRKSSHFMSFDLRPFHVEDGIIPPIVVPNTVCPWCHSHLHHRLMWSVLPKLISEFLENRTTKNKLRLLHFAPEKFSTKRLSAITEIEYITTDYLRTDVAIQLDMCNLGIKDESLDLIIASHVLEHVPSDKAAFEEIFRILHPGGAAVLLVPLLVEKSFERTDVISDVDRIRYYGQDDHVRAYGMDFKDRVAQAGFDVEVFYARNFPHLNHDSYLLNIQGVLFLARKPLSSG